MICSLPLLTGSLGRLPHGMLRRGSLFLMSAMVALAMTACERDAPSRALRGGEHGVQAAPEVQIIDPARQQPLPRDSQRLPLARVLQIALAAIPGEVIEVELDDDDDEDDDPEYEVTILTAQGRKMEVKIDARSGDILEIEED